MVQEQKSKSLRQCWHVWGMICLVSAACASSGWQSGIHAKLAYSQQSLRVIEVEKAGPAAAANLRVGDHVIAIDGWRVKGKELDQVVRRLRGPTGSTVKLIVVRGQQPLIVKVVRAPHTD